VQVQEFFFNILLSLVAVAVVATRFRVVVVVLAVIETQQLVKQLVVVGLPNQR
jgi:hypothetical protein